MMARRIAWAALGACLAAVVLIAPEASGETSSWRATIDPTKEKAPEATQKAPAAAPKTRKVPLQRATPTEPLKRPLTAPVQEDDAYALFDQGRYAAAVKAAVKAAEKGDAAAHTLIGRVYEEGLGVDRTPELAAQWYQRASDLGDQHAQFALGLMYAEGRGVNKDLRAAATQFELAAKQGHAIAQYNIGLIFAHGEGRKEDFAVAAYWFEKSAASGYAPAQYDLGALYATGTGVPEDLKKAAHWTEKAAVQGLAAAQFDFARMLVFGQGTQKDEKRAANLIRSAAEKGHPIAQNRLARYLAWGVVFEPNIAEAAKWHLVARRAGVSDLRLDDWLSRLTKEERAEAERAADAWLEAAKVK
ncbi:MAG: sel1 repeat family protein [Hyphomicrobiaceae bacterium]|nr:MAG: sel1 repeat family protein [Hyphomicrobiaceae bacterium]